MIFSLKLLIYFIPVGSWPCEFTMVPDVYILLSNKEERVQSSYLGDRYTHLAAHSLKISKPLSANILLSGNSSQRHDCKIFALTLVLLV